MAPTAESMLNKISYTRDVVRGHGGDELAVGRWGTGDTIVAASHGITANHLSWSLVGREVAAQSNDEISVIGIDHRGRAGSADVPGPFGLARHADDLVALLDHYHADNATLAGHSMGGFVAALAAERHVARVNQLVLVDGGLPFDIDFEGQDFGGGPDAQEPDTEELVRSVIGPALDRLDQRWDNEDDYVDFFVQHPAFQPPANQWWPTAEAYVRYDAVNDGGQIRSSVNKDAVVVDGGSTIVQPDTSTAIERINLPSTLLWAPRGLLDQTPGLYTQQQVAKAAEQHRHLCPHLVTDTNHYTILVGATGAAAVAEAIVAAAQAAT